MRIASLIIIPFILVLSLLGQAQAATLDWWQFWTDPTIKPVIDSIVTEFESDNPGIEVNLTDLTWANGHEKIVIALASGTGPDILELGSDWIAQFADNDHLADLTGQVSEDDLAAFHGWGMGTYREKIYARPWILGTRVIFANGELLDQAGFEDGYVPATLDQMKEAVYRVDSLGKNIYGWGSNTAEKHRLYKKFLPFFWTWGAQVFSDDGRYCVLSSNMAIDALKYYKELHDSCGYVATQRGIEDAFLDGKVGFIMSGDWLLKRIENEKRPFNLRSTLVPGERYPGKSFLGGEMLAVNAASESQDEAARFIAYVTQPENQVRFCKANRSANPSSTVAQSNPYFTGNVHLQTFIMQLPLTQHPPVNPNWVNIESLIEEAVEEALFGSGLVGEPLRIARGKIDQLIVK